MYIKMIRIFFSIVIGSVFNVLPYLVYGQVSSKTLQITDSLAIIHDQVSIDSYKNFYLSQTQGAVLRLDSTSFAATSPNFLLFSPEKNAACTLIEARNPLRIFIFYREFQEYILLDRFMTLIKTTSLQSPALGFVRLAAPSADQLLWVLDDGDFSLKKYQQQTGEVLFKTPLDLLFSTTNYDIIFLTEYQNQVFLIDKNSGILVFDNMGNFLRKINQSNIDYFNFDNEIIYWVTTQEIMIENLYNSQRQTIKLPKHLANKVKKVLYFGTTFLLFTADFVYRSR